MPQFEQRYLPLTKLQPHPRNARIHPTRQIRKLARLIEQVGFINPIIINENHEILAGHGRALAAKQLGLHRVPVLIVSGLGDAEQRTYLLADNKLTEYAGYDRKALAIELSNLAPILEASGLDIDLTGYEPAEVDMLLLDHVDGEAEPADVIPAIATDAVSRSGDLWQLGEHRLACGDARDSNLYRKLMNHQMAAAMFVDPPYNLRVASIQGRGKIKHREFAQASGEMTPAEFTAFLSTTLGLAARHLVDGSISYVCIDWRHIGELQAAGKEVFSALINLAVWIKSNAGQGSFYRSQHELILVYKKGDASHLNNVELGKHGRNRSNVWNYAGVNTFGAGRLDDLARHPTPKPIAMVADAMRDCSRRGDLILDPFMGSGTAILAAERVGRRAYGIEIDAIYVDAAIRRWQAYTKRDAVLAGTRRTFDEVMIKRASKPDGDRS